MPIDTSTWWITGAPPAWGDRDGPWSGTGEGGIGKWGIADPFPEGGTIALE